MKRRGFLIGAGVVGGVGTIVACCGGSFFGNMFLQYRGAKQSNVGSLSFANELAIPPLVEPRVDAQGRKHFSLELRTGKTRFVRNGETATWGVSGNYLGPTIRASRGDTVVMEVRNELPEDTSIHWHGAHLPPAMDGGPHQMISSGDTWRPTWTIRQPASTLWYHPHPHGHTATHVYRGIAGMFVVDDELSSASGLPDQYGVNDIPLIVQDKVFKNNGALDLDDSSFLAEIAGGTHQGILGDTILINGTYDPKFTVTTKTVRLRLLNASNARVYNLGFTDAREFALVATENGFLEKPETLTRLQCAPGERAEIVVSFVAGERVILRSYEQDLGAGFLADRFAGADDVFDLIKFTAANELADSPEMPTILPGKKNAGIAVPENAKVRKFRLSGTELINGKKMDMSRIDEVVPAGAVEIWEITNPGEVHSFHIHGVTYRVLEYAGGTPPKHLRGPKDTVYLYPSATVRLAVAFDMHTDANVPYMYHCHILRHEDQGMMGQFTVVPPGTEGVAPRRIGGHHGHHN